MNNKSIIQNQIRQAIDDVRRTTPLALSLTNFVTMNFVANCQLAIGGTAAMVHLADEAIALAQVAGATYINLGTLIPHYREAFPEVARVAHESRHPWVLDPVGAGLGQLRGELLAAFKAYSPTVIRGNASEILTLARQWQLTETTGNGSVGVDAQDDVSTAHEAAIALAHHTGGTVAVSGNIDLVTDGQQVYRLAGGSEMMTRITGCGCALGGIIATYCCVATPLVAALAGQLMFNRAGEQAEQHAQGPGSFQVAFLDALDQLDSALVANSLTDIEDSTK